MMLTPKYFLEACLLLMESDWIFREANVRSSLYKGYAAKLFDNSCM